MAAIKAWAKEGSRLSVQGGNALVAIHHDAWHRHGSDYLEHRGSWPHGLNRLQPRAETAGVFTVMQRAGGEARNGGIIQCTHHFARHPHDK